MKKGASVKAILSLLMAVILFCMPVGAFVMNPENSFQAYAQENVESESSQPKETLKMEDANVSVNNMEETKVREPISSTEETERTGETTEHTIGTVSDNSMETDPELVCICMEKCSNYKKSQDCLACKEDVSNCQYIEPNVKITIKKPSGWHKESAKVKVTVEDTLDSGNFTVHTLEAKISQNGSWTDITEDKYIEISENCSVYVRVTDQKGKTYERNRSIICFDNTKPTLNAAVSDGMLSIQARDSDSGIKVVYVNGYEFTNITNGTLNIRLQQFDTGYQNFSIQAMDEIGNMSEVYKTANPYYSDPEKESDGTQENPAEQLPVNAKMSNPSSATANVTEHVKTDSKGNPIVNKSTNGTDSKDNGSTKENTEVDTEKGKEFYTIQTASEKVFYLVIEQNGEEEVVYFLTEISENDLLNVTSDNSEVLPKNSAALESSIQVEESALPNNNEENIDTDDTEKKTEDIENQKEEIEEEKDVEIEEEKDIEESKQPEEEESSNPFATYIFFGIVVAIAVAAIYFFKIYRRKGEDFEDDDEEEEEYENEEEESEENFFNTKEESEE